MKTLKRFALIALVAALPLTAQMPPPGGGPGGPGGPGGGPGGPPGMGQQPPDQVLKEALGLSADQMTSLQRILEERRTAGEALGTQIREAERAFGTLVTSSNPDPAEVGRQFLALEALRKQGATIQERFRSSFDGILTADQKAKVTALGALDGQLKGLGALHALGL